MGRWPQHPRPRRIVDLPVSHRDNRVGTCSAGASARTTHEARLGRCVDVGAPDDHRSPKCRRSGQARRRSGVDTASRGINPSRSNGGPHQRRVPGDLHADPRLAGILASQHPNPSEAGSPITRRNRCIRTGRPRSLRSGPRPNRHDQRPAIGECGSIDGRHFRGLRGLCPCDGRNRTADTSDIGSTGVVDPCRGCLLAERGRDLRQRICRQLRGVDETATGRRSNAHSAPDAAHSTVTDPTAHHYSGKSGEKRGFRSPPPRFS